MGSGGTGSHDCIIRAFQTILDGKITGNHVDDIAWHKEWGYFSRTALEEGIVTLFDAENTSDARAYDNTDAPSVFFRHFKPRILKRLNPSRHSIVNERVHFLGLLFGNIPGDIKSFDCAPYPSRKFGDIKSLYGSNPALAIDDAGPRFSDRITNRRNRP